MNDREGARQVNCQPADAGRAARQADGQVDGQAAASAVERPWARTAEAVLEALQVSAEDGLSETEVRQRRRRFGANCLRAVETRSAWQILVAQFRSLIVALLAVAMGVAFAFGDWVEGIAIGVVILVNAAVGFVTELRAVRSMEALQRLGTVDATVRREGQVQVIPAVDLVPGDVVLVEGGDVVTADLRLLEASKLQANESALTGESLPVEKQTEVLEEQTPLAERANMLFKGTAVTRGSGMGVVVASGMRTEVGQISALVEEAEGEVTPLERRLAQLGRRLVWVTLAVGALVVLTGILSGRDVLLMVETGIALAVASIPEGLPIVATVALARGMWRMAQRNALINRLSAVETLGATSVILTDKTGTLTENQMTATRLVLDAGEIAVEGRGLATEGAFRANGSAAGRPVEPREQPALWQALLTGVLANNAALQDSREDEQEAAQVEAVGDPTEVALLVAGAKAGLQRPQLLQDLPEVREVAFESESKIMATVHREEETDGARYRVAVKGALGPVLAASSQVQTAGGLRPLEESQHRHWRERNDRLAAEGLRVLALATKTVDSPEAEPYTGLTFLGLVALADPPRGDVRQALAAAHDAGIRVVMATGDQPQTARSIAQAVGLVDDAQADVIHGRDLQPLEDWTQAERARILRTNVFARVSPRQKLDLIAAHQDAGAIVAMTGDGVNDAPALKKADIGVAMGQRGTQVAREAADMVLTDDAFATIVAAVRQGRVVFGNIRKFVLYLLSCNVSEVMVVAFAALLNAPLPLLPLQILFLNLVTDVFPALALGMGEGDPAAMRRPPRDPQEPVLTRAHWLAIAGYGLAITVAVLGALGLALAWLGMERGQAVTVSFLTLAFAQLWHVFNMRESGSGLFDNEITRNRYVWGALLLCTGLLLGAVYVPGLSDVLQVTGPGLDGWALVLGMSLLPLLAGQILKQARVLRV